MERENQTKRCKRCRQVFTFLKHSDEVCPTCAMFRAERLERAREIIEDNIGISVIEVHNQTGVPVPVLLETFAGGKKLKPFVAETLPTSAVLDRMHAKANHGRFHTSRSLRIKKVYKKPSDDTE